VRFPTWLKITLVVLLLIGVAFRFVNLNHKVYWHDEVYTSMRAAGYTRGEIDQALFQNHVIPIGELQRFQQIKPASTLADTVHSLAVEDPQHPPLYFAIARFWMQRFGSSLTASRLLPALISLLALPLMYALAWELFTSHGVALMATTLLALSPFDVLFAQTARQYSLLTVMVIASQWLLLRALRGEVKDRRNREADCQRGALAWGWYALSVALGLYTQPFFGLTVMGQAVYVGVDVLAETRRSIGQQPRYTHPGRVCRRFCLAIAAGVMLFTPWLAVLLTNRQRALATTDWSQISPGIDYLVKLWVLSFTSLLFDLDVGFNNPLTFLLRVPALLLIGISLYTLCRRCERSTWLLIVTSILVPFLVLALPDLIIGGKRSAVSRYLVSCYPGIQLAVAYCLATGFSRWRHNTLDSRFQSFGLVKLWLWNSAFVLFVLGSLASLTVSAASYTWWNKDLSYFNWETAQVIRNASAPIVISDIGDDFTNTGDLISLSYLLDKSVPLLLSDGDVNWVKTADFDARIRGATAIAFRPSQPLRKTLDQTYGYMPRLHPAERLWQVPQNRQRDGKLREEL
jgi:uncharacterized membrane protein